MANLPLLHTHSPSFPPILSPAGCFLSLSSTLTAKIYDLFSDLMIEGGNAIEAAILVLICMGVVQPEKSGIGGGHFMTIYNA